MKTYGFLAAGAALTALLLGGHLATEGSSQIGAGRTQAAECCDLDGSYGMGRVVDCDAGPVELRNSGGLEVEGELTAESDLHLGLPSTQDGWLRFYSADSPDPVMEVYDDFDGVRLITYADNGNHTGRLEADGSSGGGGYFEVMRNTSLGIGLLVDGNYNSNEGTRVSIYGVSSSMVLDATDTGDGTVELPDDAINADETKDEAGCASATKSTGVTSLTGGGTIDTILSRSITVPADGYVMVIGTMYTTANHVNGSSSNLICGVSDNNAAFPANQEYRRFIQGTAPTGSFAEPVTVHGLWSVGAGTHTYYLLAEEFLGTFTVQDAQLTLLFVPTAYGTVVSSLQAGPSGPQGLSGVADAGDLVPPLSPADLAAEKEAEGQRYRAAVEERFRVMEERYAEQQAILEQVMREEGR